MSEENQVLESCEKGFFKLPVNATNSGLRTDMLGENVTSSIPKSNVNVLTLSPGEEKLLIEFFKKLSKEIDESHKEIMAQLADLSKTVGSIMKDDDHNEEPALNQETVEVPYSACNIGNEDSTMDVDKTDVLEVCNLSKVNVEDSVDVIDSAAVEIAISEDLGEAFVDTIVEPENVVNCEDVVSDENCEELVVRDLAGALDGTVRAEGNEKMFNESEESCVVARMASAEANSGSQIVSVEPVSAVSNVNSTHLDEVDKKVLHVGLDSYQNQGDKIVFCKKMLRNCEELEEIRKLRNKFPVNECALSCSEAMSQEVEYANLCVQSNVEPSVSLSYVQANDESNDMKHDEITNDLLYEEESPANYDVFECAYDNVKNEDLEDVTLTNAEDIQKTVSTGMPADVNQVEEETVCNKLLMNMDNVLEKSICTKTFTCEKYCKEKPECGNIPITSKPVGEVTVRSVDVSEYLSGVTQQNNKCIRISGCMRNTEEVTADCNCVPNQIRGVERLKIDCDKVPVDMNYVGKMMDNCSSVAKLCRLGTDQKTSCDEMCVLESYCDTVTDRCSGEETVSVNCIEEETNGGILELFEHVPEQDVICTKRPVVIAETVSEPCDVVYQTNSVNYDRNCELVPIRGVKELNFSSGIAHILTDGAVNMNNWDKDVLEPRQLLLRHGTGSDVILVIGSDSEAKTPRNGSLVDWYGCMLEEGVKSFVKIMFRNCGSDIECVGTDVLSKQMDVAGCQMSVVRHIGRTVMNVSNMKSEVLALCYVEMWVEPNLCQSNYVLDKTPQFIVEMKPKKPPDKERCEERL